jgi:dTDP-4-amino-4,6-dideoxygalactose transaminase
MVVLIDFPRIGIDRAEVMGRLKAAGIGTQVHYIPLPFQPLFGSRPAGEFPGAARFYERCLSLPFFAGMADTDVDRVVEALAGILATARQNAL